MSEQPSSKPAGHPPIHCVIGSGPAAVSCATALLKRGCTVQMLDAGIVLEPERDEIVKRLRLLKPEQWDPQSVDKLKEGMEPGAKGIPDKRLFGSNYPYREAEDHLGITSHRVGLRASLAFGGLSTVWGAAMLPYRADDIPDWPISIRDLAPHYESVLEFTPLSGDRDHLDELFPTLNRTPGWLQPSQQAKVMLNRLDANHSKLEAAGIFYGRARVAIQAAREQEPGCVYCGFCIYGCPYGYIYRSDHTVAKLKQSRGFSYQSDVVITTVQEDSRQVTINGYHRLSRAPLKWKAHRVYLAAGVIATTRILLRSMSAYDRPVQIKDSQYFLLPMFLTRRVSSVRQEKLHALSQVFLEILDPQISPHAVHLQVYSYSDLSGKAIRRTLGPLARPFDFAARELEGRLLLIQGFLHSAHSSRIETVLRKDQGIGRETFELKATINPHAKATVRRVVYKLLRHARKIGVIPLPMLLQVAEPGRGFHAGGSFPMRASPSEFESDRLGRPAGCRRVHAVDATVFPSIPATTITFSTMANAYRIGWEAAVLD
jgi:ferredoxin